LVVVEIVHLDGSSLGWILRLRHSPRKVRPEMTSQQLGFPFDQSDPIRDSRLRFLTDRIVPQIKAPLNWDEKTNQGNRNVQIKRRFVKSTFVETSGSLISWGWQVVHHCWLFSPSLSHSDSSLSTSSDFAPADFSSCFYAMSA
jgi:hypothetical protein